LCIGKDSGDCEVNPRPAAGFTWQLLWQRRVVCTPISTNGVSSFWDFGDGSTLTANVGSHTYATNGVYTVRLVQTIVATGCKDTADIQVVADHTGVRELKNDEILVYPNPAVRGATLQARLPKGIQASQFECLDISGKLIWRRDAQANAVTVPVDMAPGLYLCRVISTEGAYTARLLVEN